MFALSRRLVVVVLCQFQFPGGGRCSQDAVKILTKLNLDCFCFDPASTESIVTFLGRLQHVYLLYVEYYEITSVVVTFDGSAALIAVGARPCPGPWSSISSQRCTLQPTHPCTTGGVDYPMPK
jgi:hypothetical protein